MAGLTFADLASFIDNRINQQDGDQALQPLLEKPRFHILRDACVKQDYFYLILHQLYCLWSVSPRKVSDLLRGDIGTVSIGFGILGSVLDKNLGFSRSNLEWCAHFPCQHADLSHSPTVLRVTVFLARLANWEALNQGSSNQSFPYLMDEMINRLQCYSVILQNILFTASRRRLGILDGHFGTLMDQLFRKDQQDHIADGQFRVLLSSDNPGELEKRNQGLIRQYQQIISAAMGRGQENVPGLIQRQSFRNLQVQRHSPQQADFHQSVFQPNSWLNRQQDQIVRANQSNGCLSTNVSRQISSFGFASSPRINHRHDINLLQVAQRARANVQPIAASSHFSTPHVPRPGQVIDRSRWAQSHQDRKSLMISLHQAQARSPDRTRRAGREAERYYQAVRSFAIEPFRLIYFHELDLTVAPENHSLLCKMRRMPPASGQLSVSICEYTNGSLRYRLRCCQTNADKAVTESDWVTKETSWPDYIFPHFNGEKLVVRRGAHHGKDLPVEMTDFVVPGLNKLKVATMQAGPTADKIVKSFHLAVEVVETKHQTGHSWRRR
ncbi:hypothetical protein F5883DRAFT_441773 [Diaporthe sp. PMI_573]|nr:hypothetical protein F5883DRAFT_441773 [Diaporthaceae sp. PMI_573]